VSLVLDLISSDQVTEGLDSDRFLLWPYITSRLESSRFSYESAEGGK